MATNRISTFYDENVSSGAPSNRASTLYAEVITPAPIVQGTNRMSTYYLEAVTSMAPSPVTNRVSALYLEIITGLPPAITLVPQIRAMILPP